MSPATIAIIPLIIVAVLVAVMFYKAFSEGGESEPSALFGAVTCTLVCCLLAGGFAYFVGVVYFNDWSY